MKKTFSHIAIVLVAFFLASCKGEVKGSGDPVESPENSIILKVSKEEFRASGMRLDTVSMASFPALISANGVIEVPPNNRATISSYLGGYIKDFPLLIGDRVKKGQKLLTIENLDFLELQQQYLETGQRLKYLEAEYGRQKELYEEKINSQKVFMQAENEYQRARILHQGLAKKLRMINIDPETVSSENLRSTTFIYAPISGSVTRVFVNSGTHVTPDEPIMEIVNSDHLHLEIQVFEKDALRIEKDQEITFRVPEHSNQEFTAEVHLIGRSVEQDRTVKVHAHLDESSNDRFIPGMFVQAEILAEESLNPALPVEAFTNIGGKTFLLELVSEDESSYTFRKAEAALEEERKGYARVDLGESAKMKKYLVGFTN